VLVPALNAGRTLRRSLCSALSGTYQNIEVVVIDDGSVDNTAAIAEELSRTDGRVRLRRRPNGGVAAALNSAIELARGTYIARLDADDLWHPSKLEKQLALAVEMPEAAFIYSFVRYIDGEDRVLHDGPPQRFPPHALVRSLYESLVGGNSSALIKRSVAIALGGFDESLSSWEDLDLQLRICASHPIAFVPEYLVGYRVRPESLSQNASNMFLSWLRLRQKAQLDFKQVPYFVHRWAHGTRCAHFAESFAWNGRYGACAVLLMRALTNDPAWTLRLLHYRIARRVARRISGQKAAKSYAPFEDCEPSKAILADAYHRDPEARAVRHLHETRIRQLTGMDERLARPVT
jgi:glycosyltransferase involved in cell wall biosynthesis